MLAARARGHDVSVADPLDFQIVISRGRPAMFVGDRLLPPVDLVAAGFPCTDLSQAGNMKGITGEASGLVGEVFRLLPSAERIDQIAYRTVVFAFPIWTFGIMAGAIWADEAWGRYWGWDPTETWAFITWVLYACYLHARATAGWRGRRAHYLQLLGFASLTFNMLVVQVFITGMHSYAGVG